MPDAQLHKHKIIKFPPEDKTLRDKISRDLGISSVLSQLIINRGINSAREADAFLNPSLDGLLDPHQFADMHKAVQVIREAAKKSEEIMIFGDYDADGVTSAALLKNTLEKENIHPLAYIPHRVNEGYGLNAEAVRLFKEKRIGLVITADCGTGNSQEVRELISSGIKVVITDHHQPHKNQLPAASAIINPKMPGCPYQDKNLAGVGVAYKLAQALTGDLLADELDLVSLGTIADVVPLVGENRIIAKEGLKKINEVKRVGLKALIEVSRIGNKEINSTFVSFILGPRINASGRLDTAQVSFRLLVTDNKNEADELARKVDSYNRQRQKIENGILEEAQAIIEREIDFKDHKVIVVASHGWHQGVLGIVASKLSDRFYRPTIAISLGEGLCRGSGRSIKGFHLFSALSECHELLEDFGGHSHAVGLVLNKENIDSFRKRLNTLAKERLTLEDLLPSLEVDMKLELGDLSLKLAQEIGGLEPFGTGNPKPLFFTSGLRVKGEPAVLSRDTLKFWVTDGKLTYPAIGFGMGSLKAGLINASGLELVYTPKIDSWRDDDSIILEVEDIFFR